MFCQLLRCQPCHLLAVRYVQILALLSDAVYMFTPGWENPRFTIPPLTIPPFVVSPWCETARQVCDADDDDMRKHLEGPALPVCCMYIYTYIYIYIYTHTLMCILILVLIHTYVRFSRRLSLLHACSFTCCSCRFATCSLQPWDMHVFRARPALLERHRRDRRRRTRTGL